MLSVKVALKLWWRLNYSKYGNGYNYNVINRSTKQRRSTVVNYFADGVLSDSDQPMLNGVPSIKKVQYNN